MLSYSTIIIVKHELHTHVGIQGNVVGIREESPIHSMSHDRVELRIIMADLQAHKRFNKVELVDLLFPVCDSVM